VLPLHYKQITYFLEFQYFNRSFLLCDVAFGQPNLTETTFTELLQQLVLTEIPLIIEILTWLGSSLTFANVDAIIIANIREVFLHDLYTLYWKKSDGFTFCIPTLIT